MMKTLILLILAFSTSVFAADQSDRYQELYKKKVVLEPAHLESLKNTEIVLLPGIVSESFIWEDHRGSVDFSILFKDYFGAQLSHYKKLGVQVSRLKGSSKAVSETIAEIDEKVKAIRSQNKKALFVSHSLGGLALLDWIMAQDQDKLSTLRGIVFLQSPFFGSPVASVYFENPYYARTILGPIVPFFNATEETIKYLSVEQRQIVMANYEWYLRDTLKGINVITMAGLSLKSMSLFRPSLNIMGHGCLVYVRGCRSKEIYSGELDDSDGMVPFYSSKLEDFDFVKIKNVDHGETVLQMPFNNIDRVKMTDVLVRMVL